MAIMRKAGIVTVVLLVMVGLFAGTAFSRAIIRPAQGSMVRGKVQIEISRASVGAGGYAVISINDLFRVAVAGSDPNKSIIYIWDTKSPLSDALFSTTGDVPKDGNYTIAVEVHDDLGKVVEKDQVSVNLANKIIPKGSGKMTLAYKYVPDSETWYQEKIEAKATDLGYFATQYRSGDVDIINGTALWRILVDDVFDRNKVSVRFKVSPDSTLPVQNQVGLFPIPNSTLYGFLTKSGDMELSKRSQGRQLIPYTATIPVAFPNHALGAGDSWRSKFINPAIVESSRMLTKGYKTGTARHTLLGYEWESGKPCAKIRTNYEEKGTTPVMGLMVKYETKAEQISYFAYTSGKMLRSECTTTIRLTGDQTTIGNLLTGLASLSATQTPTNTMASGTPGVPGVPMIPPVMGAGGMEDLINPAAPQPFATAGSYPNPYPGTGMTGNTSMTPSPGSAMSISVEIKSFAELSGS